MLKALPYIIMCIPAVLMTVVGILISYAKRDATMINHHHARSFNINAYSKKVIPLFVFTGILFSVGGMLLVGKHLAAGITIMFISLMIFTIRFIVIQKKH